MTTETLTAKPGQVARLPAGSPPVLVVSIHTEEEFDWGAGFDRDATSVAAMDHITVFQELFDKLAIRPAYMVGYPVAAQEQGAAPLREFQASGRAEIGAHLHPWVCPPHEEEVCNRNSYPGNLPRELETAKLTALADIIEDKIGVRPRSYLAGRYGRGPNTAQILEELGYDVDLSPSPAFDFRADGGPDYSSLSPEPRWFGDTRPLLSIPNTGAFVGFLSLWPDRIHRLASNARMRWARLPGILARLRALERIRLSPEGFELGELQRLTLAMKKRGVQVYSFSFHSPSAKPGCTPYVQSQGDLTRFLECCQRYCEFFRQELGGVAMTPLELHSLLSRSLLSRSAQA